MLLHLGSGTAFAFAGKWLADRFALPIGQIGTVLMVLGIGTLLGSLLPGYASRKLGRIPTMAAGMGLLIVLYPLLPYGPGLPLVTAGYLLIFAVLGVLFPIVMEALTSLNASVRGTISSLANSTMNGANTVGAWAAGLLYVRFGGYASIGLFASVCLALSLGTFLLGGLFREREAGAEREAAGLPERRRLTD
ncbi:MFS transporter [Paenibacillus sp. CC-CFT747]|nr:MFS transporter [Paenibacillus sp. CC-CFT747]